MQGKRNKRYERHHAGSNEAVGKSVRRSSKDNWWNDYSTIGSGYSAIQLYSLLLSVPALTGEPCVCSKIFCQSVSYHNMSSSSLSFKGIFWVGTKNDEPELSGQKKRKEK